MSQPRGKAAHRPKSSSGQDWVIEAAAGEPEAGSNILKFEIRKLAKYGILGQPSGKKV